MEASHWRSSGKGPDQVNVFSAWGTVPPGIVKWEFEHAGAPLRQFLGRSGVGGAAEHVFLRRRSESGGPGRSLEVQTVNCRIVGTTLGKTRVARWRETGLEVISRSGVYRGLISDGKGLGLTSSTGSRSYHLIDVADFRES